MTNYDDRQIRQTVLERREWAHWLSSPERPYTDWDILARNIRIEHLAHMTPGECWVTVYERPR